MKSETEIWIERLEAAIASGEKLPPMSMPERRRIETLMFAAGRFDLMVRHVIPHDGSYTWRGSVRDYLIEHGFLDPSEEPPKRRLSGGS